MAAAYLLKQNPSPTDDEIEHGLEGNLCRCTGYANIKKAVRSASNAMNGGSAEVAGQATSVTAASVEAR